MGRAELHTPVVRPLFFNSPKEDDAAARAWLRSRLLAKFEELDGRLAGVSGFLVGSDFTVADAYLFVVLSWAPACALVTPAIPTPSPAC